MIQNDHLLSQAYHFQKDLQKIINNNKKIIFKGQLDQDEKQNLSKLIKKV